MTGCAGYSDKLKVQKPSDLDWQHDEIMVHLARSIVYMLPIHKSFLHTRNHHSLQELRQPDNPFMLQSFTTPDGTTKPVVAAEQAQRTREDLCQH